MVDYQRPGNIEIHTTPIFFTLLETSEIYNSG